MIRKINLNYDFTISFVLISEIIVSVSNFSIYFGESIQNRLILSGIDRTPTTMSCRHGYDTKCEESVQLSLRVFFFSDEVTFNLNVFSSPVEHRIWHNIKGSLIITQVPSN